MITNDKTEDFRGFAKEIETKYKLREAGKKEPKEIGVSRRHENRPSMAFISISTVLTTLAKEMHDFRKMLHEKTQDYIFATSSYSNMSIEERKELDETITMFLTQFGLLINQTGNRINGSDGLKNAAERVHLSRVHEFLQGYLKETTDYVTVLKREHLKRIQSKNKTISDRIKEAEKDGYVFIYNNSLVEMADSPQLDVSEEVLEKLHELKNKYKCLRFSEITVKSNEFDELEWKTKEVEEEEEDDGWDNIDAELIENEPVVLTTSKQEESAVRNRKKTNVNYEFEAEKDDLRQSYEEWKSKQNAEFATQFQQQTEILREQYVKSDKDEEIESLEQQISEIQSLSSVFSDKIMDQERDIDIINDLALHTTENLVDGNEWIRKAITNSALRRVILLFCIIVLTFTLLFLDWYNV